MAGAVEHGNALNCHYCAIAETVYLLNDWLNGDGLCGTLGKLLLPRWSSDRVALLWCRDTIHGIVYV